MKSSIKSLAFVAALALTACAPDNPKLGRVVEPEVVPEPIAMKDHAKVNNQYESPKVDILFVMDNSISMDPHRDMLVANIDKFAESFIKNTDVDFHIGVVKAHDSITYGPNSVAGELIGGFVSRSADTVGDLRKLLNVKTVAPDQGGPQFEEVFSPIKGALSEPNLSTANAGFYRQEAHLAVIIITDAADATPNFDETNLEAFLYNLKGKRADKFSLHAVLAYGKDRDGKECAVDPSLKDPKTKKIIENVRIDNLLKSTGGEKFSLCDTSYGRKLGAVGSNIAAKAVFNRVVELTNIPHPKHPIIVRCEGKEIPRNQWKYDDRAQQYKIEILSTYRECRNDNADIEVEYIRL